MTLFCKTKILLSSVLKTEGCTHTHTHILFCATIEYNFPAILGYQFAQSQKIINLLSLIARNKPLHMKVSKLSGSSKQILGKLQK